MEVDGEGAEFEHTGKDLVIAGDFVEDQQYALSRRLLRDSRAGRGADDPPRLQHDGLHDRQ